MKRMKAYCSFCRKSHQEVGPLVEGANDVFICAECIELCQSIIDQEKRRRQRLGGSFPPLRPSEEIQALLHSFTRMPQTYTQMIASALHSHWYSQSTSHSQEGTKNIFLLISASPSSAIFLARVLAHILDVPFAYAQATALAPTCQPTNSQDSVFFKLLHAANFDFEAAQRGIVFLDGFDSLDAQGMLVNLLRGVSVLVPDVPSPLQIDASSILFICRGAFAGLDGQMVQRGRHPEQPITNDDLLAWGATPQFLQLVRAVVRISPLDEATVVRLIASADLEYWPNDKTI